MSLVHIDLPFWSYLKSSDQNWLQRELDLTVEGRDQTLTIHTAPKKKLRRQFPQELGRFFCDIHAEDISGKLELMPPEAAECDCCREWASFVRVKLEG